MNQLYLAFAIALFLPIGAEAGDASTSTADVRECVVGVVAVQRFPNLIKPWLKGDPQRVRGTGTVIEGGRIITSAHLVTHASQIYE